MNNISSFLTEHRDSNKPFLIYRETELRFSEVNKISKKGADFLIDINIKEENVAVFASNSLEYIFAYFAIVFSGSTNIPVNVKLTDHEILSELNYCDCNWILVQSEYTSRLLKMTEAINIGIIQIDKYGEFKLVKKSNNHVDRQNNSDIAVMLHTSGTTGNPKKVMLSHRNLFANTISNIRSLNLTSVDTVLVALPLFFGYCHTAQFLTHTRLGGTIVIYDKPVFSAKHFLN